MNHPIERLRHTNPTLKVHQDQGQRTSAESQKKQAQKTFSEDPSNTSHDTTKKISREALDKLAEEANTALFGQDTHLQFKIHEKTGEVVVKLVHNETNEVVKEIPPEKLIDVMVNLCEMVGILVDKKA
jgi:flagellar protein FlaG